MNEEDCLTTNWFEQGQKDAVSGAEEPKLDSFRRSCSRYEVQVDGMGYLKGFEKGLQEHCTYFNGLARGKKGHDQHDLCEEANPKYKAAYEKGYETFKREQAIEKLEEELIAKSGGQTCSFSNDCIVEERCISDRCESSGDACSFDSDCMVSGQCSSESQWTSFGDRVSVDVCTF
jgi:hypothetical protein